MKIDKTIPPLPASQIGEIAPRSPNNKPSQGSQGAATASTAPSSTSVHLGTGNAQLRSLGSSVANSSVVDAEKVAAIKQAISEGRFKVNPERVADGLIDSVKDMINANKSGSA